MVWLFANLSLCTRGPEFARMLLPEGRVVTWVMERGRVQPMPVCLSRFYGCVEWECCAVFWSATGKPRKSTSTCEFTWFSCFRIIALNIICQKLMVFSIIKGFLLLYMCGIFVLKTLQVLFVFNSYTVAINIKFSWLHAIFKWVVNMCVII